MSTQSAKDFFSKVSYNPLRKLNKALNQKVQPEEDKKLELIKVKSISKADRIKSIRSKFREKLTEEKMDPPPAMCPFIPS